MVNPVLFIAGALLVAFLYPLAERLGRRLALAVAFLAPTAALFASIGWARTLVSGSMPLVVGTAGFEAPLSINLVVGVAEAVVLVVLNLVALVALGFLTLRSSNPWRGKQIVLFFVLLLGSYGLVMTNDLFNIFVFMEISGISIFGLVGTSRDGRVFEAGFKYMVAAGLASAFFLIGTGFVYRITGTLNLTDLQAAASELSGTAGVLALVFLLSGILVELKPAPANGWALDVYESADHGTGALLSAVNATAMAVVLLRLKPLLFGASESIFALALVTAGAVAFLVPHIQGLMQTSFRRLLGYSSVAQVGLVVMAASVDAEPVGLAVLTLPVAVVLLLNHALAKAGLFWLSEALGGDETGTAGAVPASRRGRAALLIPAGIFVLALLGLPPFPAFWAKWNLLMALGDGGNYVLTAVVLGGSLLEAVYLLRWLVALARSREDAGDVLDERVPADDAETGASGGPARTPTQGRADASATGRAAAPAGGVLAPWIVALVLAGASAAALSGYAVPAVVWAVPAAVSAFAVLDALRVPFRLQLIAALGVLVAAVGAWILPLTELGLIFGLLFGLGAVVQLVAFFARPGRHPGLVAMTVGMVLSLIALVQADSPITLFLSWEFMTLTSFFLIVRGRYAAAGALRYVLFSLVSAFVLLAALALPDGVSGAAILTAVAALVKVGAIGVHVWLPPAYAESDDDVSALLSSVLSKAGVFLLFAGVAAVGAPLVPGISLPAVIGWIGVATAVGGALMAIFQEDVKYVLAYSSMSQVGYMVLSFAALTHLGWLSGLYLAVTHLFFKGVLFLAIAGVVLRTGTRLMYHMGGLIKRMPVSFVTVLIAIIALSGVPPLSGFGGKWLLYTALIEKGWYLQAALALFASGVAFLYLFRLIHTVFLGQMKAEHRSVAEAPVWLLVPQVVFMLAIMAVSMYPNLLIAPLQAAVEPAFAATIRWSGFQVISSLGYWNGNAVMYVTMGVFILPLLWLLVVKGRTYKVEQFNIVFAAERPATPQSTHYAFNFFGHYRKALGPLAQPWLKRFWAGATGAGETVSNALRAWNTGNPQTYAFQIVLYLFLVYVVVAGGV